MPLWPARAGWCMDAVMTEQLPPPVSRPPQRGGGVFIALGLVAGGVGGAMLGQAALGLLAGLGIGMVLAIGLALRDRR